MSVISISEKHHGTVKYCCGLLPTFLIEGNDKFQLEVSENTDVIDFPLKFMDPWILSSGQVQIPKRVALFRSVYTNISLFTPHCGKISVLNLKNSRQQ